MRHRIIVNGIEWWVLVVKLEEWNSMKRLLTNTNKITANTVIQNSLLCDVRKFTINFKDTNTWCNYYRKLSSSIETSVQIMFLENIEANVENFEEITLWSCWVCGLRNNEAGTYVILQNCVTISCEMFAELNENVTRPIITFFILNCYTIEVFIETTFVINLKWEECGIIREIME